MAQSDQIEQLTRVLVAQAVSDGAAQRARYRAFGMGDSGLGILAKACGTTAEVVACWERGTARPTVTQALAWLTCLHENHPTVKNGAKAGG